MRSINLGIRVKQGTTLTITLAAPDGSADVRMARDDGPFRLLTAGIDGLTYQAAQLAAGDYVLVVDCTVRPVHVETSASAAFWSIDATQDPPAWKIEIGRAIAQEDPKNPWPMLTSPLCVGADAYLAGFLNSNSAIAARMQQLLDASTLKGAHTGLPMPATHALLIGIDRYEEGPGQGGAIYRSLRGCVHDVLEIEKLLREQVPGVQVTRMIAPRPRGPGSDLVIHADCVPTYTNIVAQWRRLIETATPGDIVYIHYSGHGGRARTLFPAYKPSGIDESLAPCDINDRRHGRYLRDVEVALLLQRMALRELVTTVVLDSCHSGDATRGDQAQARQGDREDTAPRDSDLSPSAVGTTEELEAAASQLANRPVGLGAAAWRISPELRQTSFHTVIAACRGHEAAYEFSPDMGTRTGALTHFWLKAMEHRPPGATYRQLFDQVYGEVRACFASQTPQLLGEGDRLILGTQIAPGSPAVPIHKVDGDEVTLGAGAPVLCKGMHLALVPPGRVPELEDLASLAEVEVTRIVDDATALARRVHGTGLDADRREMPIAVGSQGIVRSYPPRMQRTVRLPAQNAPAEVLDRVAARIATDARKLLAVTAEDGADYQVFVDELPGHSAPSYRICDAGGTPLPYVPPVAIMADSAASKVVDQLVHLARYANVRTLANHDRGAPLAGKLELEVLALPGYDPAEVGPLAPRPIAPGPGVVRIEGGTYFCLRIRSRSAQYLHIAIIDLQANWAIDTLVPGFSELPPFGVREIALLAELPDPEATSALEVVKVLATREPIKPELLALPRLGETYVPRGERKSGEPALLELFRILQEPLTEQRKVSLAATPSSNWVIAQAEIEIVRGPA